MICNVRCSSFSVGCARHLDRYGSLLDLGFQVFEHEFGDTLGVEKPPDDSAIVPWEVAQIEDYST